MWSLRFSKGPLPVLAAWLQKPRKAIMASLQKGNPSHQPREHREEVCSGPTQGMVNSSTNGQNASTLVSCKSANQFTLGSKACRHAEVAPEQERERERERETLWRGQIPEVGCSPAVADLRLAVLVADLAHGVKGHHTQESTLQ